MKYNKFEIHKTKEHKILRKVKKNWIIISMSFFSFVGGGMLIDDGTNVHADTINSNNSSSDSTISSASTNSSASASMETSATSIGTNSYASANDNNTYSNSISVTSSSANASNNSSSVELASTNVSNNSSSSSSTSTNISNININISSASLSEMVNNISSIPTSTNASSNNISATSISTDASSNNSKSTSESSNNSSSVTSSSTSTSSYDSNSSSASMDSSNNNVISPSYSANDGTGIQNIDDFDWAITIGEADYVNAKDAGDWAKKIDPMGAQWLPIIQQYVNNGNYIVIPQEHIEDAQKLFNSYVKDNNLSGDYINYENHPFDRSDDYSVEGEVNDPYVQSEDGVKNVAEFSYNYNHDDNLYSYFPTDSLQLNNIVVPIDFGNGGSSGTYVSNPDDNEDEISTDFQKISNYAGHYQAPIYLITMKDLTNTFDKYSTARANPKSDNNENNSAYYNYDGQATAGIPLDYMIYLHPQVYDKNGQLVTSDLTKSAPIVNIHYLDVNNNNKQVGTQDIFAVPNTKLNNYLLTPTPGYQIQDLNGYINVTDSQKDYGVNVIEADSSAVSNSSESSSTSSFTASTSNNSATDSSTYDSEKASAASQAASSDSSVASSAAAIGNNNLASSASNAASSEANDARILSEEFNADLSDNDNLSTIIDSSYSSNTSNSNSNSLDIANYGSYVGSSVSKVTSEFFSYVDSYSISSADSYNSAQSTGFSEMNTFASEAVNNVDNTLKKYGIDIDIIDDINEAMHINYEMSHGGAKDKEFADFVNKAFGDSVTDLLGAYDGKGMGFANLIAKIGISNVISSLVSKVVDTAVDGVVSLFNHLVPVINDPTIQKYVIEPLKIFLYPEQVLLKPTTTSFVSSTYGNLIPTSKELNLKIKKISIDGINKKIDSTLRDNSNIKSIEQGIIVTIASKLISMLIPDLTSAMGLKAGKNGMTFGEVVASEWDSNTVNGIQPPSGRILSWLPFPSSENHPMPAFNKKKLTRLKYKPIISKYI